MTRTRLLGQQERGRNKHTHSERSWASEEGGKLGPCGGGTAGTGGAAEREQQALEELWRLKRQECIGALSVHSGAGGDSGLHWGCEAQTH